MRRNRKHLGKVGVIISQQNRSFVAVRNKMNNNRIPRFIELKGCINCPASKTHKETHGTDYGFDHEIIASCLISGCMDYGYNLGKPFIDPDEAIRIASNKAEPEFINQAERYADRIRSRFAQFYAQQK